MRLTGFSTWGRRRSSGCRTCRYRTLPGKAQPRVRRQKTSGNISGGASPAGRRPPSAHATSRSLRCPIPRTAIPRNPYSCRPFRGSASRYVTWTRPPARSRPTCRTVFSLPRPWTGVTGSTNPQDIDMRTETFTVFRIPLAQISDVRHFVSRSNAFADAPYHKDAVLVSGDFGLFPGDTSVVQCINATDLSQLTAVGRVFKVLNHSTCPGGLPRHGAQPST